MFTRVALTLFITGTTTIAFALIGANPRPEASRISSSPCGINPGSCVRSSSRANPAPAPQTRNFRSGSQQHSTSNTEETAEQQQAKEAQRINYEKERWEAEASRNTTPLIECTKPASDVKIVVFHGSAVSEFSFQTVSATTDEATEESVVITFQAKRAIDSCDLIGDDRETFMEWFMDAEPAPLITVNLERVGPVIGFSPGSKTAPATVRGEEGFSCTLTEKMERVGRRSCHIRAPFGELFPYAPETL